MINIENLYKLRDEGLLTIRPNRDESLFIANYTPKVQFDKLWTDELKQCRGLIFNKCGDIIARPFPKFFNLGEHEESEIPNEPFEAWEKMDGSLGILYFHEGPKIATRGSFDSEQAIKANEMLTRYDISSFDPTVTYLFEIIYPDNRIVVDYGQEERLVLLAMIETDSGDELYIDCVSFPDKVKAYDGINDLGAIQKVQEDNKEGFVIQFQSGMRVKVKFEEYVRLHRILTQVSNKAIWEYLRDGNNDLAEILDRVPDEFYTWVRKVKDELLINYQEIDEAAMDSFMTRPENIIQNRKDYAAWATKQKYPALLFNLLDSHMGQYEQTIWKMIKPKYERPFKTEI